MITLYKFGPLEQVCDASPFCVKVEAYMRMAGLPYEVKTGTKHLKTAPKGKLPYIEDNGKRIADSGFIVQYFKETYGDSLDSHLSDQDKAIATAFTRLLEENLYWVIVHARWLLPQNAAMLDQNIFGAPEFLRLPLPLRAYIKYSVKQKVKASLHAQGLGRHSHEEITAIGNRDLLALANFLQDKPYFFGNEPSSLDAIAYGSLANILLVNCYQAPIIDQARTYENLSAFTRRFHERYFG
ncbi:MAG: glutathione S-transferase [Methylobacter sp.]|nr:MAG: glutathione S-transferase [Methylobacter sp.]PPD20933.1 MAG: glutathione S-transferase [Methylobacter sp.]